MYILLCNADYSLTRRDTSMPLTKAKKEREEFINGMAQLIKNYETWFEYGLEEDVLPEGYKFQKNEKLKKGVPSLGQMVAILNDNLHGTRYGNKWTRQSLKMLIDELKEKGGKNQCRTQAM